MGKLKINKKNEQIFVTYKLGRNESINYSEMSFFQKKSIRGFMKPEEKKRNRMVYSCPNGITLECFLKKGISKNDFYLIIAQTNEAIKKAEKYNLRITNLVLSLKETFINTMTQEVHYIYQPVDGLKPDQQSSIFKFMYDIISMTTLVVNENREILDNLNDFLHSLNRYSPFEIDRYIERVYPQVYTQIERQQFLKSQNLKSGSWDYFGNMYKNPSGKEETEDLATACLDTEPGTVKLDDTMGYYDEEGTMQLEEYDPTTELYSSKTLKPYILKFDTGEKVLLDKSVFHIGRDERKVDYCIRQKMSVSSIHLRIQIQGNRYYITDLNSTNGTSVNGQSVTPGELVEIYDGDAITLGNEGLEFRLE